MVIFKQATSKPEFEVGKKLFQAYVQELGIDLSFQNFSSELEQIEEQYGPPNGTLVIAYSEKQPIGCFGIRKLEKTIGELKRMYIVTEFRGSGIGKLLLEYSIKIAGELGYEKLRLDTLPTMQAAIVLYRKFGFYEIDSYRFNPIEGALYFEKNI